MHTSRRRLAIFAALLAMIGALLSTGPAVAADTGSVSGTVVDADGQPLAGLFVGAYTTGSPTLVIKQGQTDSEGRFTISGLAARTYKIGTYGRTGLAQEFWQGVGDPADATLVTVTADEPVTGIALTLRPSASISGRVAGASSGATLKLYRQRDVPGDAVFREFASTSTFGNYSFAQLPAGTYRLGVPGSSATYLPTFNPSSPDLENAADIVVAPGDAASVSFTMRPTTKVKGIVLAADGLPVVGATVTTFVRTEDGTYTESSSSATTDAQGAYSINRAPGDIKLRVTAPGFITQFFDGATTVADGRVIVHTADSDSTADVALVSTGLLSGTVRSGEQALPGIKVWLYRLEVEEDDGEEFEYWDEVTSRTTSSQGAYSFTNLPAGTYVVSFEDPTYTYASETFDDATSYETITRIVLGANGVRRNVDADLPRAGEITGTVIHPGVSPNDVYLSAGVYEKDAKGEWSQIDEVEVAANGTYRLRGLAPGTYRVGFDDWEGVLASQYWERVNDLDLSTPVTVTAGGVTRGIDASMVRALPMTLRVPPVVQGVPSVGTPLTIIQGTWSGTPRITMYQWYVDDEPIQTPVPTTYTPTADDIGKPIVVEVLAFAPGYQTGYTMLPVGRVGPRAPETAQLVRRSASTATLSWAAVPDASSYKITARVNGRAQVSATHRTLSGAIGGLTPGTAYTIDVQAVHRAGGVSPARTVAVTTPPMAKPAALRATARAKTSITVAWTRPEGAVRHRVTYWTGSKPKVTKTIGAVGAYKIAGLKKKKTYSVQVQSIAANGVVTTSPTIKVKTK